MLMNTQKATQNSVGLELNIQIPRYKCHPLSVLQGFYFLLPMLGFTTNAGLVHMIV